MLNKGEVLILGQSGFIGSHLAPVLQMYGRKTIGQSLPDMDLSNRSCLQNLVPYLSPTTTVILLAAVKRQFGDTMDTYKTNVAIVSNICELIAANPVRRVLFLSSAAVYGEETHNTNINEATPVNPTSYYGIAKYAAERLLQKALRSVSSLICMRPPLVYGSKDAGHTYGPAGFVAAAKNGVPITLWGDGMELREFLYVDDLCEIIAQLIDSEYTGVVNTVSGTSYNFTDIIKLLQSFYPNLSIAPQERTKRKVDNVFDPKLIMSLVPANHSWTSLKNGIANLLDLYPGNLC